MASRNQIGSLLVEAGVISAKTLERALALQERNGKGMRLGKILREIGIVTDEEVIEALARQCNLRSVRNFAEQSFPKNLLDLVPVSLAVEKLVFPLKQYEGMLAVATHDPFDRPAFEQLGEKTGMRIYPVLATRGEITTAIRKHYLNGKRIKTGGQKILLIDPSPIITKMYEATLVKEGYEVRMANDGVDGLKLAFCHLPDLILCDLTMPRLDAYNFMLALRAHAGTADIPVILMSSIDAAGEEHRALQAGFADFIGKPAMPVRILARIKKAFALREDEQQPAMRTARPVTKRDVPPWVRRREF